MFILRELANNGLKNNDKTSGKISINQGKDTYKKASLQQTVNQSVTKLFS